MKIQKKMFAQKLVEKYMSKGGSKSFLQCNYSHMIVCSSYETLQLVYAKLEKLGVTENISSASFVSNPTWQMLTCPYVQTFLIDISLIYEHISHVVRLVLALH